MAATSASAAICLHRPKNIFYYRVVKEWNDMPPALKDWSTAQFLSLCKGANLVNFNDN
ncbi:Hypothetical predicted protein [Cloeon dipterum]|uniref:Uncharacterized protein n=1 Tax=Cloeon dipterum TaxID=197152 RepID=A0A8S1DNP5_9INSE|nr:Hypothetical predicted protein [Cloeon dipterum]